MNKNLEVLPDQKALIERSLNLVVSKIKAAIAERDRCTIALSGGSTPKALYQALAQENLPWEKIHVFWGDERYVSAEHPDSNQRMAGEAWLDRVNIPEGNIHPMPTDAGDPAIDAQKHDRELQEFFGGSAGEIPVFDIILLGMGDDGHTASLFPHTEALQVRDRLVTVGNKDGQPRITFTVPLINQAISVIFIVAGASKKDALTQVFAPHPDGNTYPSALIQPKSGELWWLLDRASFPEL
jgi:6-phosphogluconolactonase